ncbi:hypothetical protein KBD20_03170 [Candidatus Saccharibacteria bacterium]|nr:hypothetical protein [Candidatus Saccharibacteria bacterium]
MELPRETARLRERTYSNPLEGICSALERLGIVDDGEYYFSLSHLYPESELIALIKDGGHYGLAHYSTPAPAVDTKSNIEYTLVRNQVLYHEDDELVLATGDVIRCEQGNNHPGGMVITEEFGVDADCEDGFKRLMDQLETLVACVRTEDLIDETEVSKRLKDACAHGDLCL